MAWASTGVKNTGATGEVDIGTLALNGTTAGSFIVAAARVFDGDTNPTTLAVSDNVNGSYTQSFIVTRTNGIMGVHYFQNNGGGDLTISFNASGASAFHQLYAHEFTGGRASPASGTPSTNTGNDTSVSTGSMTPADNDVLLIAFMIMFGPGGTTITENAGAEGFTLSNESQDSLSSLVYKIISGAPGTPSHSWSTSAAAGWDAGITAFAPSISSSNIVPNIIMRKRRMAVHI